MACAGTLGRSQRATKGDRMSEDRNAALPDPVGGQAVLEGVMMRRGGQWSLAVRDPEGSIHVEVHDVGGDPDARWRRLPVLRGVGALGDSLRLGYRALMASAARQLPPGTRPKSFTVAAATSIAVFGTLFVVAPLVAVHALCAKVTWLPFALTEGVARIAIFLGYVAAISRLPAIRRVFEYHGAEHQSIACAEAGLELTPANAAKFSVRHPRCGTAFLLWVLTVAVAVYAAVPSENLAVVVASRIIGLPLIAGLSYELIRATARHQDHPIMRALARPGLALQDLTTRTPDHDQLEVAIAALRAVAGPASPAPVGAGERT